MNKILIILILMFSLNVLAKDLSKFFVAVIDTGIDSKNSPNKNRIVTNLLGQSSTFNSLEDSHNPGHGTHVAHIIIQNTSDDVYVVPYKAYDFKNSSEDRETTKKAEDFKNKPFYKSFINSITKSNIKLVNISGGGNVFRKEDYEAFKNAKDTLFIVAAGNYVLYDKKDENKPEDLDKYFIASKAKKDHPLYNKYQYNYYPCAYQLENIVCVGDAISDKKNDIFRILSNYGSFFVDVFANGENVSAVAVGGKVTEMSGSSMSTPKITALFAKEWSKNPKLSISELKAKVFKSLPTEEFYQQYSKFGYYLPE